MDDTIPQPLKHFTVYGIFRVCKDRDFMRTTSELVQLWSNEKDARKAYTEYMDAMHSYNWSLLPIKVLQQ